MKFMAPGSGVPVLGWGAAHIVQIKNIFGPLILNTTDLFGAWVGIMVEIVKMHFSLEFFFSSECQESKMSAL